jgi:Mg-chelatase subunit ChlD
MLMDDLEEKLKTGQITWDEYNRQKSGLMAKMRSASEPVFKLTSRELASTIMEMIDAQDKQWNREVSFQAMHAYYHIKENSEGAELSPEKRDYYTLQKLIEDMERRKILMAAGQASSYMLTGMALNILLKYLIDQDITGRNVESVHGRGKALAEERNHEVRRYSSGDAFRDISIRQTLKQTARQKKSLAEIRSHDLRVFLKQPRKPQSDVILCLDTSGSMGFHQKLMYARLVAAGLVQAALKDRNRVGIVAFNDHGQITIPLTDTDKDSLLNCLAGLNARGNTNIGEGIRSSSNLLFRSYNRNQKHIVLISDGQPTALSESSLSRLKDLGEKDLTEESALLETRQAAAKGVQLSVIHIAGQGEASDSFIKNIAKAGKGKIRRISGPEDLKGMLR